MLSAPALLPILALLGPLLPPETHVVADDGGGDFDSIQDAIDAASSGDVIVVHPGGYGSFDLDGKGLAIVGTGVDDVFVNESWIRNVPAGESATVAGVRFSASPFAAGTAPAALTLHDNAGSVWLEDCRIQVAFFAGVSRAIFEIEDSASVVVLGMRTRSIGGTGSVAVPGIDILRSSVHVYDSDFEASTGQTSFGLPASDGGVGAVVGRDSFLFASSTRFQGGAGILESCALGGTDGGAGMNAAASAEVHLLDCELAGGAGGPGTGGLCLDGMEGEPGPDVVGVVDELAGTARTYALDPFVFPGETATLVATGIPGETVFSLISTAPLPVWLPVHLGSQLVAAPLTIVPEGVVPASGILVKEITPAAPAMGDDSALRHYQGFFVDGGGTGVLGSGATVLVDSNPCAVTATVTSRHFGPNAMSYTATPAVLGSSFTATVDLTTTGHTNAALVAFDSAALVSLGNGQVLLVTDGGSGELFGGIVVHGPIAETQIPVPVRSDLCGATVYSQAVHFGGVFPFALSNSQDLVLGGL